MITPEQEGRAIARGGLLPLSSVEEHIQIRLKNREIPVQDRCAYAAIMLKTYFEANEQDDDQPVFWHRFIGNTILSVGQA